MFERSSNWRGLFLACAVVAVGCGDDKMVTTESGTETTGTTTGTTDDTTTTGTDTTPTTTMPTSTDPTTTDGTTTGTTTTGTTTDTTDGTTTMMMGGMCDPKIQDCGPGEKCVAYDSPEGMDMYWDANQCVPEPMNPAAEGDTCNINMGESPFSGLDNCGAGTICLNFDFMTGQGGTCTAYCGAGNTCDQDEVCVESANMGVLPICLPACDPLTQDCSDGQGCYGDPSLDGFICFTPDPGDETGMDDSPCEFTNACLPGFSCQAADTVADCQGGMGCCTPFCKVSEGDGPCDATEACVPFYPMDPPPGLEDVGVCVIPG